PQSLTNVISTSANFSVVAGGIPAPAYQWRFNNTPIVAATTSTLTTASVQTNDGGSYTVVITNSANSITSAPATLIVWVPPSSATQPQSLTNVISTTANFSVVAGGIPAPAYQWRFNKSPIAGATTSTLAIAS